MKKNFISAGRLPSVLLGAAFCTALFLPAGCAGDSETTMPDHEERVALQVSSGIDVQTRAHDDQWDSGDAIGIYMLSSDTPESINRKYTTTDDKEKTGNFSAAEGQTIYFPVDGTTRDFIAYYPWQDIPEDRSTTYDVDVTTQTTQKAIDLMGAAKVTGKDKNGPAVALVFTHKLVKLYMTIKPDGTSLKADDLKEMTVKLTNQYTKATYDVLTNGSVTVDTNGNPTAITLKTAADGSSAEGIVLPNTDTEDMQLTFELKSGETFRWTVKEAELSKQFAAGSKYIYTITIGKTGLEVTSTVNDWKPGNGNGEPGSAE